MTYSNQLKELIDSSTAIQLKGLHTKLKSKYPYILEDVKKFQYERKIKTCAEAIYLYANDIQNEPTCCGLSEKCIKKVMFQSIKDGYCKYCKKCNHNSEEYKNKIKKTLLEKYGVDNASKIKESIEKRKITYWSKSKEERKKIYEKVKTTLSKNYGSLSNPEISKKKKETCLKRFGVEHPLQSKEIYEKVKETYKKHYGVDHYSSSEEYKKRYNKIYESSKKKEIAIKNLINTISKYDLEYIDGYDRNTSTVKVKCKKCQTEFNFRVVTSYNDSCWVCPTCYPNHKRSNISQNEFEIRNYLESIGIKKSDMIFNSRKIIYPQELDIYIPSKNLAIEFDGLYWHASNNNSWIKNMIPKHKNYHMDKTDACERKGIKLLTIFEDDWIYKKDIVKDIIKSNLCHNQKIYARNCQIKLLSVNECNHFLNSNHIQGCGHSKIKIGLINNDELVSVMTFSNSKNNTCEINRFSTKLGFRVIGGASKLLKYYISSYQPSKIISYADRKYSTGTLYNKLGFKFIRNTKPNYWWFGNGINIRKHRSNFTKSIILKKNPNLDSSKSDIDLMTELGYSIIYDCGSKLYELQCN